MIQHPWREMRARTLLVFIVLVSYGAVGARQPAVRTSIRLPLPAAELAVSLRLHPDDRAGLLTSIVRLVFDAPDGASADDQRRRASLDAQLHRVPAKDGDLVPLPLDPSVWRETLLQRNVPDAGLASAILADRSTALLYHGLAALDDETLAWVGPERETLVHLRRNAAVFAPFGRSVRVRAGRVAVPGGEDAEPIWSALVGADPAHPAAFVQRLIRGTGRLAWFYDTVMHLDAPHQSMLLAKDQQPLERLRDLLGLFESVAPEWHVPQRPFVRPALDPALVLSLISVDDRGAIRGPAARDLWSAVFSDDRPSVPPAEPDGAAAPPAPESAQVDAAWLARRFAQAPAAAAKRRLETFLLAQRVFGDQPDSDRGTLVVALRGAARFPALAMTLERIGVTDVGIYAAAARAATSLGAVRSLEWRRTSIAQFQAVVAIIDRAARMGGLDRDAAVDLVASLLALEPSSEHGYASTLSEWIASEMARALPAQLDSRDRMEDAILASCAGVRDSGKSAAVIRWEGQRYRIDPAVGELQRLRRIRERQRASQTAGTLDAQLALTPDAALPVRLAREQRVAAALTAIVYAFHLGEADGAAASAGDVAARHDFALADNLASPQPAAWRVPHEEHGSRAGWRVVGSLLGLDVALARLALRRLDLSDMPGEPAMSTSERTSAIWTAALFGPLSGAAPPREIAAAIDRGRAVVAELRRDRSRVEAVAQRAALSEWRREALRWTLANDPERVESRFSLLELLWLGSRLEPATLDPWGAARVSLDGSLRLRMPRPQPWESLTGRPSAGHLASLAADVGLRVAEVLSDLELPAAVAPAVMAYALQDVIDAAQPAYFDDWPAFQRAARDIPRDRVVDYVSAAGAQGVFVPLAGPSN